MQKITVPNDILLPEVERMLGEGLSVTLRVKGYSMLPFIVGDRDSVVLVSADALHEKDIVLVRLADKRFVLHRIIRLHGKEVTLMGDGNLIGTEHCSLNDISGKVTQIIRNGKYIDVNSNIEKFGVYVWRILKPIRRYLLAVYKRLYRIK